MPMLPLPLPHQIVTPWRLSATLTPLTRPSLTSGWSKTPGILQNRSKNKRTFSFVPFYNPRYPTRKALGTFCDPTIPCLTNTAETTAFIYVTMRLNSLTKLDDLRAEIDCIDDEIISVTSKRITIAKQIADYKKHNGLPVIDKTRENQVLTAFETKFASNNHQKKTGNIIARALIDAAIAEERGVMVVSTPLPDTGSTHV